MTLRPGIYLVERNHLGRDVERPEETLSLMEFLRRVQGGGDLSREICIVGLDHFLAACPDLQEAAYFVGDALNTPSARRALRRISVLVFPVGYLELGEYWKVGLRRGEELANAAWIFPRADIETVGELDLCYSPM